VFGVAGTSGAEETASMDAATFKALKPGGVYMVIDHVAKAGSGEQDAKALHRIDPAVVIALAKVAGFVQEARSNLLANPKDNHKQIIFAPQIRAHTDQFVLKFRKPKTLIQTQPSPLVSREGVIKAPLTSQSKALWLSRIVRLSC